MAAKVVVLLLLQQQGSCKVVAQFKQPASMCAVGAFIECDRPLKGRRLHMSIVWAACGSSCLCKDAAASWISLF
jgi:hypothetical protein